MEDGIIFFLLDADEDWHRWTEAIQTALALQTLQEWICSDKFKEKATPEEISKETTIGQKLLSFWEQDQFWKDANYVKTRDMLDGIFAFWKKRQWVREETKTNGRPRRAEYSSVQISKALKYIDLPFIVEDSEENTLYKSVSWGRSIAGENLPQKWTRLVTMKENIFNQIYTKLGPDFFTGYTKEELAEKLHLPKTFVNELCRWLQSTGSWEIRQRKKDGERRRELRLI
jgi:hypothetical protein